MLPLIATKPHLWTTLGILLSLGLWVMLWLGVSPGDFSAIFRPQSTLAFVHSLRAALPLMAAGAAASMIGVKVLQRKPSGFGFFSPLGLAAAYGLVGLAASLKSPAPNVALWWAALHLSVPLVLWGVVWGTRPLNQLRYLVNATWVLIILAATALFVVAALYLDLVDRFLDPALFLQCQDSGWFDLSASKIRGTGVGRYAAIAGIIAISGLFQGRWRLLWGMVFLASFTLLLSTGARGAFGGFAAGASLTVLIYLIYAGKRALLSALLAILVLVPLVWGTGLHRDFLEVCLLRAPADQRDMAKVSTTLAAPSQPHQTLPQKVTPATSVDAAAPVDPTAPAPTAAVVPKGEGYGADPLSPKGPVEQVETRFIIKNFPKLTGRTAVWMEGWRLFKNSPLIGFGFQVDRLMLGTHMHNSVLHALLQTGLIGTIPFVSAMIFAWILFLRMVRKLTQLSGAHKHLVIQCGGVLAFLTMRSLVESTGAFFGVDWLILALVFFYLQVVNYERQPLDVNGDRRILEGA